MLWRNLTWFMKILRILSPCMLFKFIRLSKPFDVGLILFFYNSISYFSFFIRQVAGVFCHNFVIWTDWLCWVLLPLSIKNIWLGKFECCYLILLCSRIGEPSFECLSVFCRDITFETDALAISFGYWSDKVSAVRCEL